jgi:hypothetical protein
MFCTKCGKNNPDDSKFCQGCGGQLSSGDKQAPCCCAKNKFPVLLISVVFIAAAAGMVFAFMKKPQAQPTVYAGASVQADTAKTKNLTPKIILLISEQNIEGPQRAWWASEIDLSTIESSLAQKIMQAGFEVLEPSQLKKVINTSPAFRLVSISDNDSVRLGNLSKAQYVVVGKAIASAGGNVPQSSMRSCFANVTAKLIRVKDGKVIAYLDASGSSAHMDVVTGGREALSNAADDLGNRIIAALNSETGK